MNTEIRLKVSRKKLVALGGILALLFAGSYVYATYDLSGTAPYSVTAPIVLVTFAGVTAGMTNCTLSNQNQTFTCPMSDLTVGSSQMLNVLVRNAGVNASTPTITTLVNGTGILTIAPFSTNPASIAPATTAMYMYTVTGVGVGQAAVTVSIKG